MSSNQLRLQQARENRGYSIEKVSELTHIPAKVIQECENNGMKAEVYHVFTLIALYGIDFEHINLNPSHDSVCYQEKRVLIT